MRALSFIATTFLVGAAGVLAGVLIAPNKGSTTRNKIVKRGQEYKEYLHDNYDDLVDTVTHPFEGASAEAIRLGKKAEEKARELKNDAKKAIK